MFLLRPEISEVRFPETYESSIDGAVILGRLVAEGRPGQDGGVEDAGSAAAATDELARAARRHRVPHLHDPDTAVLPHLLSHNDDRASRACRTSAALAAELPLRPQALADPPTAERLVRATLRSQVDVTHPAPPYFEFNGLDDPWLDASLSSLAIARRLRPGRRLAVFVRATLNALESGELAAAAMLYSAALPEGALVLLGVSGLHPEESPPEALAAYLRVIAVFDGAGFDVVADRVDRFGAAAVAFGAVGLAGGTRIYRTIPPSPFWENPWSVKIRVKYSVPDRGDRMTPEDARARRQRGSIPACPVEGCRALNSSRSKAAVREHNGHLAQLDLALARANGARWVARRYEESPIANVRGLGEAIWLAMRLRAEA